MKRCSKGKPIMASWSAAVLAILLLLPVSLVHAEATTDNTLSIATWGGAYEKAQQAAIFTPFTEQTNIRMETRPYNGGLAILSQADKPDLIDMTQEDALRACDQGLLQKYDFRKIVTAPSAEQRVQDDFLPQAFRPCSIAHVSFANVVAYSIAAFPDVKPRAIADFFDLPRFPGKRGLRKEPATILEWALIARGVPLSQVYDLLSTERGLRLALEKLDSIRDHIVWWTDPDEPAALLESGQVTMSSAYNGRLFAAQGAGSPLVILWDAQLIELDSWVMPRQQQSAIRPEVLRFLRYATLAKTQARLAEHIPYGPTRSSANAYIGKHPQKGYMMLDHLPTAPRHLPRALFKDSQWAANTAGLRQRVFTRWLEGKSIVQKY